MVFVWRNIIICAYIHHTKIYHLLKAFHEAIKYGDGLDLSEEDRERVGYYFGFAEYFAWIAVIQNNVNDKTHVIMYCFQIWHEVVRINKNVFLLTENVVNKSNGNV